jgi:chemotaxis protein histidine kinase CheA
MEKAYSRINWKNGSRSTDTPLNETNMNLMDSAIDVIDGRVCQHDAQIQTLQGYETRAAQSAAEALQSAQDAEDSATDSANSASASSQSASASALSASSASASATSASQSASSASTSETNASQSETNALASERNAKASEDNAKESEENAETYQNNALVYKDLAYGYKNEAQSADMSAQQSASNASTSETNASASATLSQSYAVGGTNTRTGEDTDNAKYYKEQAEQIADNFNINNETPTFAQASTRANINSGETISTIMGKIKKFFADLKTVAFTGNASDVSFDNTGTTSSSTTVQAGLVEALSATVPTASNVPYTNTTSGLSATNVQSAIDEVVDISGNTSSALVEQSIGTFPEFAISTNSADSYYSDGRGGVRDSNDKIIIIGMCRYNESNSGQYYVGFMLYGTSAQALAQSSYTPYGQISIHTFVTPQGNTVYVARQDSGWVYNTVTNPYTASSTKVTINGNTATLNNVFIQNTSGVITSSQADKMLLTIVDEVLFGNKEYSSGIYQVKSNNEIISLFENSVAHNEPNTTASQAYSVGQYLTQGGNLKKVTSAIASGEPITGNNTSNTTVGEELRQLNSDLTDKSFTVMASNQSINLTSFDCKRFGSMGKLSIFGTTVRQLDANKAYFIPNLYINGMQNVNLYGCGITQTVAGSTDGADSFPCVVFVSGHSVCFTPLVTIPNNYGIGIELLCYLVS